MQRVLITGALGYLGQIVLKRLQQDLLQGRIAALVAMDIKTMSPRTLPVNQHYVQADIRDKNIAGYLEKYNITTVIHLAAIIDSQSSSREFQYEVDVLGTKNILEACLKTGVQRIIISSSGAAYGYHEDNSPWLTENDPLRGNEIFAYSAHKRLVEEMLAGYRLHHPQLEQTVFRVCTILGATTQNLITNLFDKKQVLGLRHHLSPYVFIWDEDVADCLHQAVFSKKTGVYNLAGDGAICNADLAKLLNKRYLELPVPLLKAALTVGHRLGLTQYGPSQLLFIQYRPVLDNQKLKQEFGFTPQKTSLETFIYYRRMQKKPVYAQADVTILYPDKD